MLCIKLLMLLFLNNEELINNSEIVYPKVSYAIHRLETGNGSSKLYKNHHNMYGFKSGGKYKKYRNKQESVQDYVRFERKVIEKYNIKSRTQYINTISRFYARDTGWRHKIIKMI